MIRVVHIGEVVVSSSPDVLEAPALGSCVAVALFDKEKLQGGLAHIMLPGAPPDAVDTLARQLEYAETSVQHLLKQLEKKGSVAENLIARIAGGASMFPSLRQKESESIGFRNVASVKETLKRIDVSIIAEDVGGNHGRTVQFDLASGLLLTLGSRQKS